MNDHCVLTIAVPTFNMERWLEKNLATYDSDRLFDRLEVLCLNNASEDSSRQIIEQYVEKSPRIFRLIDRDSRGYGSSINAALSQARGSYFRIVDADDWVDTEELIRQIDSLEQCDADVVLTDYQIVNMQNGAMTPVKAADHGIDYNVVLPPVQSPLKTLPSIHNTTYRTQLLRDSGFYMQDKMFFVDEEYVILPYLSAKSVIYYPFDVYRYQVANPGQSTSPKNRAKYQEHRELVLRRLILAYDEAKKAGATADALAYCFERIKNGVGDHFTTLYIYVEDRKEGRKLATRWKEFLIVEAPEFWKFTQQKAKCLSLLNRFQINLPLYEQLKGIRKRANDANRK